MNDIAKTSIFIGVAAVLTVAAAVASIPRVASVEDFRDQGQGFFPEFTDPDACASLEVIAFDPATVEPRDFKVMKRDSRWVIPSHSDYPADAKDRLAKTAAQVIGLTKDTIRSSRSDDHVKLGVLDPLEVKSIADVEGVGKRIILRDKSDKILADYIIGKDVPGRPDQKFIRRPGQTRTYGVTMKAEVSTSFADWIEPNLLDLDGATVRQVVFDNNKVDTARGEIIPGEQVEIARPADGTPWTMPGLRANDEVNPEKTAAMIRALTDLKIVGVRPKPRDLAEYFAGRTDGVGSAGFLSLKSTGFHPDRRGGLLSNEGSLIVGCNDGTSMVLRFGKVTFARGVALSAGTGAAEPKVGDEAKAAEPGAVEARYLFVTALFNADLIEKPKPTVVPPLQPGTLPKNVFAKSAEEIAAERAPSKAETDAYNARVTSGKARVEALSKRFAPWYYLVPGDAYRSLVMDTAALIRPKQPEGAMPPGGNPFGPGGMPGGMPRGFPPGGAGRMPSPHGR